jgi:Tol biopolymer transport system component
MNAKNSSNGGNVMNPRKTMLFITVFFCALLAFGFQSAPEYELLFEKAKFTMETKGDLKQAVVLFQEIIEKYPQQRQYAAKSHLYIGLCYEKLGYSEAVKAYELVLEKYADQPEQVAAARARLAALRAEKPRGLTLTKIEGPADQYLETQALSPDGTKMAGVVFNEGQNIAVYDLVTKRIETVTHLDWINVTYFAIWSPDGKKIAYQQYGLPNSQTASIYLMVSTLDGQAEPIFSTEKGTPVPYDWLPDGSAVVATLQEGEDTNLGLVTIKSGAFKTLHALKGDFHSGDLAAFADASPDGRHIVFADGRTRNAQNIYCIGTDGRSLEVLIDHIATDIQPRWSPDGDHVVFQSCRSGAKALWGVGVKNGKPAGEPFIIQEM